MSDPGNYQLSSRDTVVLLSSVSRIIDLRISEEISRGENILESGPHHVGEATGDTLCKAGFFLRKRAVLQQMRYDVLRRASAQRTLLQGVAST